MPSQQGRIHLRRSGTRPSAGSGTRQAAESRGSDTRRRTPGTALEDLASAASAASAAAAPAESRGPDNHRRTSDAALEDRGPAASASSPPAASSASHADPSRVGTTRPAGAASDTVADASTEAHAAADTPADNATTHATADDPAPAAAHAAATTTRSATGRAADSGPRLPPLPPSPPLPMLVIVTPDQTLATAELELPPLSRQYPDLPRGAAPLPLPSYWWRLAIAGACCALVVVSFIHTQALMSCDSGAIWLGFSFFIVFSGLAYCCLKGGGDQIVWPARLRARIVEMQQLVGRCDAISWAPQQGPGLLTRIGRVLLLLVGLALILLSLSWLGMAHTRCSQAQCPENTTQQGRGYNFSCQGWFLSLLAVVGSCCAWRWAASAERRPRVVVLGPEAVWDSSKYWYFISATTTHGPSGVAQQNANGNYLFECTTDWMGRDIVIRHVRVSHDAGERVRHRVSEALRFPVPDEMIVALHDFLTRHPAYGYSRSVAMLRADSSLLALAEEPVRASAGDA